MGKKDPTAPVRPFNCPNTSNLAHQFQQAKMHGNEPSRGAEIDAEIQAEEEKTLKKKGASLPGQKN